MTASVRATILFLSRCDVLAVPAILADAEADETNVT